MAIKVVKTMTMTGIHIAVACAISYALTGSIALGGAIALIEPVVNVFAAQLHEKAWAAVLTEKT